MSRPDLDRDHVGLWYVVGKRIGITSTGRTSRLRYLILSVLIMIVALGISYLNDAYDIKSLPLLIEILAAFGMAAAAVCIIWGSICLDIRRLHDFDRPGWFIIPLYLVTYMPIGIPFVRIAIYVTWHLALFLIPGTAGQNRYGYNHDKMIGCNRLSDFRCVM